MQSSSRSQITNAPMTKEHKTSVETESFRRLFGFSGTSLRAELEFINPVVVKKGMVCLGCA